MTLILSEKLKAYLFYFVSLCLNVCSRYNTVNDFAITTAYTGTLELENSASVI